MVFIHKEKKPIVLNRVLYCFPVSEKLGKVGLEIEVEGLNLPHEDDIDEISHWRYVTDHSLRGEENAEYVFSQPLSFEEAPMAINDLFGLFKSMGSSLDVSNRTSIHVHLNVQQWTAKELASFFGYFFAVEDILLEFSGSHRVGNLFCMSVKDAPSNVTLAADLLRNNLNAYPDECYRYANLNLNALSKFGSLEVRSMRGLTTAQEIIDWVSILERIYKLAEETSDPREICQVMSGRGPLSFLRHVLGDKFDTVTSDIGWSIPQLESSVLSGLRQAQGLLYRTIDWDIAEKAPEAKKRKPRIKFSQEEPYELAPLVPASQYQTTLSAQAQTINTFLEDF